MGLDDLASAIARDIEKTREVIYFLRCLAGSVTARNFVFAAVMKYVQDDLEELKRRGEEVARQIEKNQ